MAGIAVPADLWMPGFDSLQVPTADQFKRLYARGFRWWGGYLDAMTPQAVADAFAANLAIVPLTIGRQGLLTAHRGSELGVFALQRLRELSAPRGLHVWTDIETTAPSDFRDVIAFSDAASETLQHAGWESGDYFGAGQPLDGGQMFHLKCTGYWKGGSLGIPEVSCNWQIIQLTPLDQNRDGVNIDADIIQGDERGRTPIIWSPG